MPHNKRQINKRTALQMYLIKVFRTQQPSEMKSQRPRDNCVLFCLSLRNRCPVDVWLGRKGLVQWPQTALEDLARLTFSVSWPLCVTLPSSVFRAGQLSHGGLLTYLGDRRVREFLYGQLSQKGRGKSQNFQDAIFKGIILWASTPRRSKIARRFCLLIPCQNHFSSWLLMQELLWTARELALALPRLRASWWKTSKSFGFLLGFWTQL
jgi:hypothetical protein